MASSQDLPELSHQDQNITVITSRILELPPSCIEFVPDCVEESAGYFLVGTYHLELNSASDVLTPDIPSRKGSLLLFKLSPEGLELIQTITYQSAILDLHFHRAKNVFAVASSTGCISIFCLVKRQDIPVIEHIITHQVVPEDILILSLIWKPLNDSHDSEKTSTLFFTTSCGSVFAITLSVEFKSFKFLNNNAPLYDHDDNAWTCAVSRNSLFSGGDDSKLARVELTEYLQKTSVETPSSCIPKSNTEKHQDIQVDFKVHDAGVTAIIVLPTPYLKNDDSFLMTGCYDDHVRVLAIMDNGTSKSSRVQKLSKYFLGGGVWRLKLIYSNIASSNIEQNNWEYIVLASCMHAGARILKVTGCLTGPWNIEVLAEMRAHQSMCYSSDFQPLQLLPGSGEILPRDLIIVSTSFYDRLLLVWKWSSPAASLPVNRR